MHFVFVHGWGFNPSIWRDVIRNVENADATLIDLGFISGGPRATTTWPSDSIAVGHSLGLLWLLHRAGEEGATPFRGLVSIQGFDRFCPLIPPSRVAGMRRGLRRDAYQTVEAFWRGCGTTPFASPGALNVEVFVFVDRSTTWLGGPAVGAMDLGQDFQHGPSLHALCWLHQQPGQRDPHGSPEHFQKHVYAPFVVEHFKATNEIGEGPGTDLDQLTRA